MSDKLEMSNDSVVHDFVAHRGNAAKRGVTEAAATQGLSVDKARANTGTNTEDNQTHIAIIDIGSNSIRLVIYDGLNRAPFPRFNEKSLCALGNSMDEQGAFTPEALQSASHSISRFVSIARAMDVGTIHVIATEATRKASNGGELIELIRKKTGLETRVLTGIEEARHSAFGILSGFYQPNGLAADMGGGSLEVAEVVVDKLGERMISMPLGALPVLAMMQKNPETAKKQIDEILDQQLPPMLTEPVFYVIGGGWRALARIHIALNAIPISVVHGYEMDAQELASFAKKVSRMSTEEIAKLPDVPTRRIETLAAAALVLARVLKRLQPERVVFSALGLREGWLYAQLDEAEKQRDPLLAGAYAYALPVSRVPEFSAALVRWTDALFPGEADADRRLRQAACALTDMAWRDHPKVRAVDSFMRLLQFPFIGISHADRAFLAVTILARYGGKVDNYVREKTAHVLSSSQIRRAEILGRSMLLAHRFSGSVPEILEQSELRIDTDSVRLEVLSADCVPDSDAVKSRLNQLAKVTGVNNAEIIISTAGSG